MFNLKRALTATALTTALAGGVLSMGATAADASGGCGAACGGGARWLGARCLWVQNNGSVHFGNRKNKLTITKFKHSPFFVRRERGCVRNAFRVW